MPERAIFAAARGAFLAAAWHHEVLMHIAPSFSA
jgi:hypothetical protein